MFNVTLIPATLRLAPTTVTSLITSWQQLLYSQLASVRALCDQPTSHNSSQLAIMFKYGPKSGLLKECFKVLVCYTKILYHVILFLTGPSILSLISQQCCFNIFFACCNTRSKSPGRLVVTIRTTIFNVKNSALRHGGCLCCLHDYHHKQQLFSYTIFTEWFF